MSDQPMTQEPGGDTSAELSDLRLRVAAQDRCIEAMLAENEDIHDLRRRNHQLEQYVGKLLSVPGVQAALSVRRRLLGRPAPPGTD